MNLHPCPLCGESKGSYIASYVGSVLPVCCAACHRAVAYTRDRHSADEAWNAAAAHAQGLREREQQTKAYATTLAVSLHAQHFSEAAQWEPLPDTLGLLTQIDNMVVGLRERIAELENEAREQALQALASEGQWIEQTGAQQKRIAELEAQLARDELSPEFTDTSRAALLWVLWHHQGGSSPVGQPLRFALGFGAHDHLNENQIAEAKRWAAISGDTTADFHKHRELEAQRAPLTEWQPIETAPRQRRFLALVDGLVRFVAWGKTSHVPMYGWCLVDQGAEDSELCEPTHWMPFPALPESA